MVSHVLRCKIIINEKSISDFLGTKPLQGKRVYGKDNKSKFVKETFHKTMLKFYSLKKSEYKGVDLHNNLRIWHIHKYIYLVLINIHNAQQ